MNGLQAEAAGFAVSADVRHVLCWQAAEQLKQFASQLRLLQTHPGGGMYHCLTLARRNSTDRVFCYTLQSQRRDIMGLRKQLVPATHPRVGRADCQFCHD